jgi:hypothetical protein
VTLILAVNGAVLLEEESVQLYNLTIMFCRRGGVSQSKKKKKTLAFYVKKIPEEPPKTAEDDPGIPEDPQPGNSSCQ